MSIPVQSENGELTMAHENIGYKKRAVGGASEKLAVESTRSTNFKGEPYQHDEDSHVDANRGVIRSESFGSTTRKGTLSAYQR